MVDGGDVNGGDAFIDLRNRLLRAGVTHAQALQSYHWPAVRYFNWARDYFDRIAVGNEEPALRVVDDTGGDEVLTADAETARSILEYVRSRVSPFKRIRRMEFADLPNIISGKIRRIELRLSESGRPDGGARRSLEFWEEDFLV